VGRYKRRRGESKKRGESTFQGKVISAEKPLLDLNGKGEGGGPFVWRKEKREKGLR